MLELCEKMQLLPSSIENVFSGKKAIPQHAHDLLHFHQIGIDHIHHIIKFHILEHYSSSVPIRIHRLLIMADPKLDSRRRFSQTEREMKQANNCLRQRLAWCNCTGQTYNASVEQYSSFPRAICDEHGAPQKGSKAVWTDKIEKRYTNQSCQSVSVTHFLPEGCVPEVIIMDAMFLIQCNPLCQTMTIKDSAILLLNCFPAQHYQAGVPEVHLLFDFPST